jgi:Baseplate J-like protein
MTNVPKPTFGPSGFLAPLESEILAGVLTDYNEAFGGNLNLDLTTPQGQLAVTTSAIIGYVNDTFLQYVNNVDPARAEGRMQDGIARIYFLSRNPPEPTTCQAVCSGLAGTIIPIGALAKTIDGETYAATQAGTIGIGGTVTLAFANLVTGPLPLAPLALNTIYRTIPGWDSVSNPLEGIPGRNVESRGEFEQRRAASVALNAVGTLPSIRASVLNVANVLDAYVTENATGVAVMIGGVLIAPHALYVAVAGGNTADIARAIWLKKNPGCDYTGTTTIVVTDNNSGYVVPFPTYNVKFTIAASLQNVIEVKIAASSAVPADAQTQISAAIVRAYSGADGGPRARIGGIMFASRLYAGIAALGSWAQIVSLQIGSANTPSATFNASIAGTALNLSAAPTGAIAVGQTLTGGNILPGTKVLSGSGLAWVLSKSQVIAVEPMATVLPNQNDIIVNINQIPTIDAADVVVTLV